MSKRTAGEMAAGPGPRQLHAAAAETQCTLVFSSEFDKRDLRLFEVPEDVLKKVLAGEELQLVGEGDAVLCTSDKTFAMKKVETSNQLFLLQASETADFGLTSRTTNYYEVRPTAPRLEQIEELLLPTQYTGAEDEAEHPPDQSALLTRSELQARVQASRAEVDAALLSLGVVELDGKMRLVSKAAGRAVARNLLDTVMENGWSVDALDGARCREAMGASVDPVILAHTLALLGTRTAAAEQDSSWGGDGCWRLDADSVAKVSAHGLFLAHVATAAAAASSSSSSRQQQHFPWEMQDFLLSWAARTPGLEAPSPALLAGICIKTTRGAGEADREYLHYLPSDSLPLDAPGRLQTLFALKPKYTADELQPYLAELAAGAGGKTTVTELLLANARLVDGHYTSK